MSDDMHTRLNAILDQLIPGNPERDIPAAGFAGVADFIEMSKAGDPAIAAEVDDLLSYASSLADHITPADITPEFVRRLEIDKPEAFRTLLRLTYMGYYSQADLRGKIGVGSWPVHPRGYVVARESDAELEALTAPVRARGPVYRSG